jgi:hypothetical protein
MWERDLPCGTGPDADRGKDRPFMTGCVAGNSSDLLRRLDATAERIIPVVGGLLERLSPAGPLTTERDGGIVELSVPVRFPDGVGTGTITARVFRYRTSVRVDLAITHNRVLARADGQPTDRHCFLNDYVASTTLGPDDAALPERFVTEVVQGVGAAVTAVENHNRRHPQPWRRVEVAAV